MQDITSTQPVIGAAARPFARRTLLTGMAGTAVAAASGALLPALPAEAASVSQNGWTVITTSSSTLLDTGFSAAGHTFPGGVRRGDVSTILRYVATRFHNEVQALGTGCWGWNYRTISGSSTYSNHASATAIDINAPLHPQGSHGTFTSAQVAAIRSILAACAGVVRWGGDYSTTVDEMHFEINRGPSDPAVPALASKLGGTNPPPPPPSGWPTVQSGSTGYRVTVLQYLLTYRGQALTADGVFGAKTKAAVIAFQGSAGLVKDGIAGPKTWAAVVVTVRNGSSNTAVKAAQAALNANGARLTVDGKFGSGTLAATTSFQRAHGLSADGIIGPLTWAALV